MEIMLAIENVLKLGCGLDLKKILRSKRYNTLRKASGTLLERYPVGTDMGTALRAGHMEFGRLVNTIGERMAIATARDIKPLFGPGLELRPLVQIVGERLVKAAAECLTLDIRAMARAWKKSSADRQVEIARTLFERLKSTSQDEKGELTVESAWQGIETNRESNRWSDKKVLPRQYGPWDPDTNVANCQGKTQMIVAFARLAGARAVTVHPIREAMKVICDVRRRIHRLITDDLRSRNITELDSSFSSSLEGFLIEDQYKHSREVFHVCVGIELCDDRWVLIDSHALNFGVFPKEWDMPAIVDTLERYKEVLPGFGILATDKGLHKNIVSRAEASAINLLTRSKCLERALHDASSPVDIANVLLETGEIWFLLKHLGGLDDEKINEVRSSKAHSDYAALLLAAGDNPMKAMMNAFVDGEGYKAYLTKRKHVVLSGYHCIAINESRKWSEEGKALHPECEITNAEYSIAISAINSLVNRGAGVHRFFLEYSFDQTTMHNALSELLPAWLGGGKDEQVGIAAARSLQSLPLRHPLCSERLRLLRF